MKVTRQHCPGDRYRYDFGPCSCKNGWAQVDTDQDASYYGIWAHPADLKVFSYVEGDTALFESESQDEFVEHLRAIASFEISQGRRPARIDPGLGDEIAAKFRDLGLADMLH